MTYTTREVGLKNSTNYKVYIEKHGKPVSPFHDIQLNVNIEKQIFRMVVDTPMWSSAKFAVDKEQKMNPIIQTAEKGSLTSVKHTSVHRGYLYNCGFFPQTWNDSKKSGANFKNLGANNPIGVIDVAASNAYTGQVKAVKVLGALELIDKDKHELKAIVIDVSDPMASKLHSIEDVDKHMPGFIEHTNQCFGVYKTTIRNLDSPDARYWCKNYALSFIRKCNKSWKKLVRGKVDPENISLTNTTLNYTPSYVASVDSLNLPYFGITKEGPIEHEITSGHNSDHFFNEDIYSKVTTDE
ncbi:hypothetical protein ACO0QE_000247 [Hanseniaspora vineae]